MAPVISPEGRILFGKPPIFLSPLVLKHASARDFVYHAIFVVPSACFSERLRSHISFDNRPPFDAPGARGEMFGALEQFQYGYYNVIPVSGDMRAHVLFFWSSHRASLGEWDWPRQNPSRLLRVSWLQVQVCH